MENNILKEKIKKNLKEKIAISNIRKEFDMKEINVNNRKLSNIVAVFLVIIMVGTLASQIYAKISWNIEFKEFENREYKENRGTIKEAFETGYGENIDMEYLEQDNIKVKIDSLIITDNYFETNINFVFNEDIKLNSQTFEYGYVVYDENNNIYTYNTRFHYSKPIKTNNYWKYLYKEIGKDCNYIDLLCDSSVRQNIKAIDNNIISKLSATSNIGFPKSRKLYIRIFDLGYYMTDTSGNENIYEDFLISDAEWIFKIDVPEQFYKRQIQNLEISDILPKIDTLKLYSTEIETVLTIKSEYMLDKLSMEPGANANDWIKTRNETIFITDTNGNLYYDFPEGLTQTKDEIIMKFPVTKNMIKSNKYYLNIRIDDKLYTSEIKEK